MPRGAREEALLSRLGNEAREAFEKVSDLEERLERALESARKAWPEVTVADDAFVGHLGRHAKEVSDPVDFLDHLHPADLYLAVGCASGSRAALDGFERTFRADIDAVLRRFRTASIGEDDMRQALHEKLFVAREDAPPKIADYAGQGFLQNWVRVTAVRLFTDLVRKSQRTPEHQADAELAALADGEDLELSFLKNHYRGRFKQAFEEAVGALDPRERNLLRQSVVHGLGIDQVAALYGIHRATAARRIERAREALLVSTRKTLMATLAIDRSEFESVMQLIKSRLDVSIHRVLGSRSESDS